jgi:hypothetical protein
MESQSAAPLTVAMIVDTDGFTDHGRCCHDGMLSPRADSVGIRMWVRASIVRKCSCSSGVRGAGVEQVLVHRRRPGVHSLRPFSK